MIDIARHMVLIAIRGIDSRRIINELELTIKKNSTKDIIGSVSDVVENWNEKNVGSGNQGVLYSLLDGLRFLRWTEVLNDSTT